MKAGKALVLLTGILTITYSRGFHTANSLLKGLLRSEEGSLLPVRMMSGAGADETFSVVTTSRFGVLGTLSHGESPRSPSKDAKPKVVIIPGNGCSPVHDANWYSWMERELQQYSAFSDVILRDMPDPYQAKESIWIPFIVDELGADENTILIGHSSGAEAAMRLLETHKLKGCVLVSACHTDLGCESERVSGYYSRPWKWDAIRSNVEWILQYHSEDDPFIPRSEADHVALNLQSDYTCFKNKSHFFYPKDVKHIIDDIIRKLQETKSAASATAGAEA
jgi:predicted alpha/beta hydrolase family esterase